MAILKTESSHNFSRMVAKRRLSEPDVPSPLRRGIGVGGVAVPFATSVRAQEDEHWREGPSGLPGGLVVKWAPATFASIVVAAVAYTKPLLAKTPEMVVFGKRFKQPRNVGLFSDENVVPYTHFGSCTQAAQPMNDELAKVLWAVNATVPGQDWNAILVNEYGPNGAIGFHSDDEAGLGLGGSVATLSWGESRDMVLKERNMAGGVSTVPLHSGMLTVMPEGFHRRFLHGIPRRRTHTTIDGNRTANSSVMVSLTFRRHQLLPESPQTA
jgi:alkylated DNA repair dioxygenase AlkB